MFSDEYASVERRVLCGAPFAQLLGGLQNNTAPVNAVARVRPRRKLGHCDDLACAHGHVLKCRWPSRARREAPAFCCRACHHRSCVSPTEAAARAPRLADTRRQPCCRDGSIRGYFLRPSTACSAARVHGMSAVTSSAPAVASTATQPTARGRSRRGQARQFVKRSALTAAQTIAVDAAFASSMRCSSGPQFSPLMPIFRSRVCATLCKVRGGRCLISNLLTEGSG